MARKPSELQIRIAEKVRVACEKYERAIDAYMDRLNDLESDGSFIFTIRDEHDVPEITSGILEELRRLYGSADKDGWHIQHDDSNPNELEFVPRSTGNRITGRLDR